MPKVNFKTLLDRVAPFLGDVDEAMSLVNLLAMYRGRLGEALAQGSITEARAIVKDLCSENPLVAGAVNYFMTQDPDSAINAIAMYDAKLAESLRANRVQFSELQNAHHTCCAIRQTFCLTYHPIRFIRVPVR